MTPIFSRSWFVKIATVPVRLSVSSLRRAWPEARLRADVVVPHLALDLLGVSAATESMV